MLRRLSKLPWIEIAILACATLLRLWLIELKPPHFDEGINGWFADQMTRTGYYRYDPTNYHGPLHFYAVFLAQALLGRALWVLRLPAIIASVLAVWAVLRFRDFFSPTVVRIAALAMAVSPAFVFYGRYSIHESWQVLFSVVLVHGVFGLWKDGARRALVTVTIGVAGLILTKETYVLHVGCLLLAGGVCWLWQKVVPSRPAQAFSPRQWDRGDLLRCAGGAALVIGFFYSGTFLDFGALRGLYQTFAVWIGTGVKAAGHAKASYDLVGPLNYYWLALMARYEWFGLVGFLACFRLIGPADARLRYLAIYAGGVLLAYSIIPYKTPWCIISILWPFFLIAGAGLEEVGERFQRPALRWAIAAPLLVVSLAVALRLNFRKFTDGAEPYVYVQTYEEISVLTGPLLTVAHQDPTKYHLQGVIALDSYYPLPWVLGDFPQVGYYKTGKPVRDWNVSVVVVEATRRREIEGRLRRPYFRRSFRLRNAQEECVAYFAADVFGGVFPGRPEVQPLFFR